MNGFHIWILKHSLILLIFLAKVAMKMGIFLVLDGRGLRRGKFKSMIVVEERAWGCNVQ